MTPLLLLFSMFLLTMRSAHGAFFLSKTIRQRRAARISPLLVGIAQDAMTRTLSSSSSTANDGNDDAPTKVLDPLIVCGPSGVGKGTIIERFMQDHGHEFAFCVSHTTRSPRPGEVHGIHYHFVTQEYMKDAIAQGKFLEHAQVHGNLYGTSWASLQQPDQKRSLLDIDVQGVTALKEQQQQQQQQDGLWKPRFIFIAPPSLELLLDRLSSRGTEDEASLQRRTSMAATEMAYGLQEGNFDAIVVNDDLDEACREFERVIQELYSSDESNLD